MKKYNYLLCLLQMLADTGKTYDVSLAFANLNKGGIEGEDMINTIADYFGLEFEYVSVMYDYYMYLRPGFLIYGYDVFEQIHNLVLCAGWYMYDSQ